MCRAQLLIVNTLKVQKYNKFKLLPKIIRTLLQNSSNLSHSTHRKTIKNMLRKLLTPNIQRIESISAIGTMLQQVLLRFGILLRGLVFAKAISSAFHASRLHRKNKDTICLLLSREHLITTLLVESLKKCIWECMS